MRALSLKSVLAGCVLAASSTSFAGPVLMGSSYNAAIVGDPASGTTFFGGAVFDGIAQSITRNIGGSDHTFTLNESQTDLGGGLFRISFIFAGSPVMFVSADNFGGVGVGLFGDVLDLDGPYDLLNSVTRVYNQAGSLLATGGGPDSPVAPWSGAWPAPNLVGGFAGVGPAAITRFELDLNLQVIPEPGSFGLAGLALCGLLINARRRARESVAL